MNSFAENFYVENFSISIGLFVLLLIFISLLRQVTLIVLTCMLILLFGVFAYSSLSLPSDRNIIKLERYSRNNIALLVAGMGIMFFLSNITIDYLNSIYENNSPFYFNLCLQIIITFMGCFVIFCVNSEHGDETSKKLITYLFQIFFLYSVVQLFFYIILHKEYIDYWWIALPTILSLGIGAVRRFQKKKNPEHTKNFQIKKKNSSIYDFRYTYLVLASTFILLLLESFLMRTKVVHLCTFLYCLLIYPFFIIFR